MVDRTVYPVDMEPSTAVRQIFARSKVPSEICLLFAKADLRSIEMISVLGDSHDKVRARFTTICGGDAALGATEALREKALLWACAIWTACCKLHEVSSTQRAKMESDPNIIPSVPRDDVADFRARFAGAHPDIVLLDSKEPHKKFIERLNRDFMVDSMVPCYEVGEFRRRSEQIASKTGMAPTADLLIKMVQIDDLRTVVVTEAEVLDRLFSFFVALEYLNIACFNEIDGTFTYWRALLEFNKEWPGLGILLKADKLIRTEVYRLNSDERSKFPTFAGALNHVLTHKLHIWEKAKTEFEISKMRGASLNGGQGKRKADELGGEGEVPAAGELTPSKKRRLKQQEKVKALKAAAHQVPAPPAPHPAPKPAKGGGKGSGGKGKGKGKGKNQNLWAKIAELNSDKCKFYNAGKCRFGDQCNEIHSCCSCGGPHPFASCPGK